MRTQLSFMVFINRDCFAIANAYLNH